jgi:hypothetical protein
MSLFPPQIPFGLASINSALRGTKAARYMLLFANKRGQSSADQRLWYNTRPYSLTKELPIQKLQT